MKNNKRDVILNKTGGVCFYCGEELKKGWHSDHFYPIKRNGDGTCLNPEYDCIENMVPSCPSCNKLKSSLTVEYMRGMIYRFVDSLNKYTNQYKIAKRYNQIVETRSDVKFWFERIGYDMSEIESIKASEVK